MKSVMDSNGFGKFSYQKQLLHLSERLKTLLDVVELVKTPGGSITVVVSTSSTTKESCEQNALWKPPKAKTKVSNYLKLISVHRN